MHLSVHYIGVASDLNSGSVDTPLDYSFVVVFERFVVFVEDMVVVVGVDQYYLSVTDEVKLELQHKPWPLPNTEKCGTVN